MLRRETWSVYLLMVCQGFLFYSIGFLTPYVEAELGAPVWASALPVSFQALGLLVAAVLVPPAVRRLGAWGAVRLWLLLMGGAVALVAVGASLPSVLAGALLVGIAGAGSLTHAVSAFAGRQNGVLLMRATLASVAGGVLGPLVLSSAARAGAWNWGVLAMVPLLVLLLVLLPADRPLRSDTPAADAAPGPTRSGGAGPGPDPARRPAREPALGRAYWLAWTFMLLCVGAESSFVAWGAQVAVAQAGIGLADATALGSLFVVGLIAGRIGLGLGGGVTLETRRLLAIMVIVGLAGGGLVLFGTTPVVAGAGLLLGGLGLAGVWPTAAVLALAGAPRSPVTASARLNPATGLAILVVPLLLGVAAAGIGVLAAWALVIGLLWAALVVLGLVHPAATAAGEGATRA
jgi:hypothetical protein